MTSGELLAFGEHWLHRRTWLEIVLLVLTCWQALRVALLKRRLRRMTAGTPDVPPADDTASSYITEQRSSLRRKRLSFEYSDVDGVVTQRSIVNWHESSTYVEGRCLSAKANRTFRKDRVLAWGDGQDMLGQP